MALELPGELVVAFNYVGLPWPGIDEDQLRAWAKSVRAFADQVTGSSARTHRAVAGLADSSRSSSIAALAGQWERRNSLIAGLHGPMSDFAAALDIAADAVVVQKTAVIGAAAALAAEFTATQAGAVFTLGADEAALPAEIASARWLARLALEELEAELTGKLSQIAAQTISDHVSRLLGSLLDDAAPAVAEAQSLRLSYQALRDTARSIREHAADTERSGDAAYHENATRDIEDPGEGPGGRWPVAAAVRQTLLDVALDLFKNLTRVISDAQEASAGVLMRIAEEAENADRDGVPESPVPGRAAGPRTGPTRDSGVSDSVPASDGDAPGALRDTPRDPVTGNPLEAGDGEFLGYHPRALDWFRNGEAPLGMTPQTYRDWTAGLRDALRADGIPPEDVDVRLLGSAGRGFSGPHKTLPADDEITASHPPDIAETAIQRKAEWLGDDPARLRGRPFDAMSALGLDEPSDYDTNISSDLMVAKAREQWDADGQPGSFLSGDHEYVNKDIAVDAFPHVARWRDAWTERLGRDVSWAVFPGTGPKDTSATSGHYVHFQDSDWIVFRPEDH